jgi:hypothetical protein
VNEEAIACIGLQCQKKERKREKKKNIAMKYFKVAGKTASQVSV